MMSFVSKLPVFAFLAVVAAGLAGGCGGTSHPSTTSTTAGTNSSNGSGNVLAITVDGGPTAHQSGGSLYENAAFASASICAPGSTSNCVTIDHLLVDTGSVGLRVFDTEVSSLGLSTLKGSNGSPAYDCVSFVDGSYLWGPVEQADVTLGSETAAKLPIQVISSSTANIPSSCSNGSTNNENTQAKLGANGILGVGLEPTDCYYAGASACDPDAGLSMPPSPAYYTCSGNSCSPAFVARASQVANPIVYFPSDNNGVIVELPSVTGSAATLTGSLVFGIGTQSNNQLPSSATVFGLTCNDFTTIFSGQTYGITDANTCSGAGSFIDSGSNGLFFPNATSIPTCPANTSVGDLSGFYCPGATENFTATNEGSNGKTKAASFTVQNAQSLFATSSNGFDAASAGLAGPAPSGVGFDWGLPFFYGVNVYNAIDGQNMPTGLAAGPWWAY
jgi:hypothetical protein